MGKDYYTDLKALNFEYLIGTRFQNVYDTLDSAKKLHDIDKGACCAKLRYALEIIIDEIIKICNLQGQKRNTINANLGLLRECLPNTLLKFNDSDIIAEMHNIRTNGNDGTHYDSEKDIDFQKATHTSWIAMKKICKWVSTFEIRFQEYKEAERLEIERKKEEEKKRKDERNKKIRDFFETAGKVAVVVGGIVIALLTGKRINK